MAAIPFRALDNVWTIKLTAHRPAGRGNPRWSRNELPVHPVRNSPRPPPSLPNSRRNVSRNRTARSRTSSWPR